LYAKRLEKSRFTWPSPSDGVPSQDHVGCLNRLSRTTGSNPVPAGKALRGYRYEADKFGIAGLTPMASETVAPPRVLECSIQLEATLVRAHSVMAT
jgi:flavin reductase (DIM6/NTAB) family NADH-FMN oxidoreductase RutF